MSLNCNGSSYITTTVTNMPNTRAAKTMCCWVNCSDFSSTVRSWLNLVWTTSSASQFGCRSDGLVGVWDYGGNYMVSTTAPATNTWFHMAYTCDGNKSHYLYINGVLVNSNTNYQQTIAAVTSLQIGGNQWGEYLSGYMDDIRIYNRTLTANEILSIYSTKGNDLIVYGLISRWLITGVAGASLSSITDSAYSKNSSTISNGSFTTYNSYIDSFRKPI